MIGNARIWTDDAGMFHYELSDDQGVPFIHSAMTSDEWNGLRNKLIKQYPPNVSVSLLTDYLTVLLDVIETI